MQNTENDGRRRGLREKIADAVDISKDVILNAALINIIGNREMTIENYRAIIEYTDELIRIKTSQHTLKISGKKLEIRVITQELLHITGMIKNVEFCV